MVWLLHDYLKFNEIIQLSPAENRRRNPFYPITQMPKRYLWKSFFRDYKKEVCEIVSIYLLRLAFLIIAAFLAFLDLAGRTWQPTEKFIIFVIR
jgi:hypothetical protein